MTTLSKCNRTYCKLRVKLNKGGAPKSTTERYSRPISNKLVLLYVLCNYVPICMLAKCFFYLQGMINGEAMKWLGRGRFVVICWLVIEENAMVRVLSRLRNALTLRSLRKFSTWRDSIISGCRSRCM